MADILVMEPNPRMNQMITAALQRQGHRCRACATVSEGAKLLEDGQRVTTILNAGMPWRDSIVFLRALEKKGLPVLFITGTPSNAAHLRAMYQSGCEVLLSPFGAKELEEAVSSLLTRGPRLITLGDLRMDVEKREVTQSGRPLSLTAQEFALLQALMRHPDVTLSRQDLLRMAWGYQGMGATRTVDVHVQRLRRKLGSQYIETIYKLGYRLRRA